MANGTTFNTLLDVLVVGGVPMRGRAPGTFITLARTRPYFSMNAGVDGLGYYTRSDDISATITLTLQPNADENTALNGFLLADLAAPNGLLVPIVATRNASVFSGTGRVAGLPTVEWTDGTMTNVWTILSHFLPGAVVGAATTPVAGA